MASTEGPKHAGVIDQ